MNDDFKYLLHYEILRLQKHKNLFNLRAIIILPIITFVLGVGEFRLLSTICLCYMGFHIVRTDYYLIDNEQTAQHMRNYSKAIDQITNNNSKDPLPIIKYDAIKNGHIITAAKTMMENEHFNQLTELEKYKLIFKELVLSEDNSD